MADPPDARASATQAEVMAAEDEYAARRGHRRPEFEWLGTKDPDYELAHVKYALVASARENPALSAKYRSLVVAAVLAFRGYPTVVEQIRRARREGASMQEILEAFEVATVPGGMPVLHFALPYLIEVDREEAAKQDR